MPAKPQTETILSAAEVNEEFGLSTEAIPLFGVRMIDHKTVFLYKLSDVIPPENKND